MIVFKNIRTCFLLLFYMLFFGVGHADTQYKSIDTQEDWGVEPVHMRLTADGYMIEFRYLILDKDKAVTLSDRKYFPHLWAMKSKAKLSVPYGGTVGFLKSNRKFLKPGKQYIAMFSNEGKHLQVGDKVRVQVKDELSEILTIE